MATKSQPVSTTPSNADTTKLDDQTPNRPEVKMVAKGKVRLIIPKKPMNCSFKYNVSTHGTGQANEDFTRKKFSNSNSSQWGKELENSKATVAEANTGTESNFEGGKSKEADRATEGTTGEIEKEVVPLKDDAGAIKEEPGAVAIDRQTGTIDGNAAAMDGKDAAIECTSKDGDWVDPEDYCASLTSLGVGRNKRGGRSWVQMALRPKFKSQNLVYAVISTLYERLDKVYPHMSRDYLDCHRAVREFLNLARDEQDMPVVWETATYVLSACGVEKFFDFWDDRMTIMGSRLGLGYRREPVPDYDDADARMKLRIKRTKQVCAALKGRKMQIENKKREQKKKKQAQSGQYTLKCNSH